MDLFLHYTFNMPIGGERMEGFVKRWRGWFVVDWFDDMRLFVLGFGVE